MKATQSLAALAVAFHAAVATATGGPVVDAQIEAVLKTLEDRVEAQTLAQMQDIVERDVVWVLPTAVAQRRAEILSVAQLHSKSSTGVGWQRSGQPTTPIVD
jgi:hypothetical protein